MSQSPAQRRYIVSNIGHSFAVHDTQVPYQVLEGEERKDTPPTTNAFTSRIVDTYPTRAAAQRRANELNQVDYERTA